MPPPRHPQVPGSGPRALVPRLFRAFLDKIASFVHLYFSTGRIRNVTFQSIPYTAPRANDVAPPFVDALGSPEHNRGLMALLDLSYDIDMRSSPLSGNIQRRNAGTHRFLVAHSELPPERSDWTEHVNWSDLISESLYQLRVSRRAVVYLAQMIDIHEGARWEDDSLSSEIMPMPYFHVDTDLMEAE